MLDRVSFSTRENGDVQYQILNQDETIQCVGTIPADEWKSLRESFIQSLPKNPDFSLLIDYLVILGVFALD